MVHPKTKETSVLPPFEIPFSRQHLGIRETPVEARHFAATWALFRVSSMKNIHLTLPPNFRDLWKGEFQNLKKEDLEKDRGWLYEADPFVAREQREKVEAAERKARDDHVNQRKEEVQAPAMLGGQTQDSKRGKRAERAALNIEMGQEIRSEVETVLRKYATWNTYGVSLSPNDRQRIVKDLSSAGFRQTHVQEAVQYCRDREEVLEWLLIHVPEDDLPEWSIPENYVAGVTIASHDLARDAIIKRLSQAGYASGICQETLQHNKGNELETAEALQRLLCQDLGLPAEIPLSIAIEEGEEEIWRQELETVHSVYGDKFTILSELACSIRIDLAGLDNCVQFQKSKAYPRDPPVISILGKDLPAYIKLSIYREAVQQANEIFLGQPMIYVLIDFLESEASRIIANPGTLRDIAKVVATIPATSSLESTASKDPQRKIRHVGKSKGSAASESILRQWRARQNTEAQAKMLVTRQSLPAWKVKDTLIRTIAEHKVTIVSGPTGSGKSTQVCQFVLDNMIREGVGGLANIICTEPRRISAIGLADRVSEERCMAVGNEIGYVIRGESKQTQGVTRVLFCTTGVLLRRLQASESPGAYATALNDVTHVIIDEGEFLEPENVLLLSGNIQLISAKVHERSLDTDFLLILLKNLLPSHEHLRVILMSATLQVAEYEQYFSPICSVGTLEIEGRAFPIKDFYLEDVIDMTRFGVPYESNEKRVTDVGKIIQNVGTRINYELITATVDAVHHEISTRDGSILIFLPGVAEINKTVAALGNMNDIYPLPLHASMTVAEQRRVFLKAPGAKRKVIAATNVAETSITIPDCIAVIDSGRVKETSYDSERNLVKLEETWASQAACKQRRGRAGRVTAGSCFKLYTRNAEAEMLLQPEPEIKRVPLEQLCLSIKAMGQQDIQGFLSKALTSPDLAAVDGAISLLQKIGALDGEQLTALGSHLAGLPCDLRCGKLMIYGALFGCVEECLTMASILTVRSPFVTPQAKRDESKAARMSFLRGGHGDLLIDLEAYNQWAMRRRTDTARDLRAWCDRNFLSHQSLLDIASARMQYLSNLQEAGFVPVDHGFSLDSPSSVASLSLNNNNTNWALLRGLIAGTFSPQFARIAFPDKKYAASSSGAIELDPEARTIKYFTRDAGRVFVHPSSTLFDAQGFPGDSSFIAYFTKIATSKVFIRDLTPFNAYSLLMFVGDMRVDIVGRGLIIDGWLRIAGWPRIGALVGRMRVLLDVILRQRLERPGHSEPYAREVLGIVKRLIELNGFDR